MLRAAADRRHLTPSSPTNGKPRLQLADWSGGAGDTRVALTAVSLVNISSSAASQRKYPLKMEKLMDSLKALRVIWLNSVLCGQ